VSGADPVVRLARAVAVPEGAAEDRPERGLGLVPHDGGRAPSEREARTPRAHAQVRVLADHQVGRIEPSDRVQRRAIDREVRRGRPALPHPVLLREAPPRLEPLDRVWQRARRHLDRAGHERRLVAARDQRLEPALRGDTVRVRECQPVGAGRLDPPVARTRTVGHRLRDHRGAGRPRHGCRGVAGCVVHDHHLEALGCERLAA
jgi:hypothetical protein